MSSPAQATVLDSPAMLRSPRALLPAVLMLAFAAAAAGCGSDSAAKPAASATSTPTDPAQEVDRIASQITTKLSQRPKIPAPKGQPPANLVAKDIVKGTGAKVKPGIPISVQYVGASWSDGKEFDASWNRGQAFSLTIPGQVIEGWNEGILGMRQGGRRLLIIPPLKGYGSNGTPDGSIKPNETLAFVIDADKVG
ncbi:MAG: peptidylprolyl isomerase [Solirubrobacteraceae bacterium]|nr:peptidylprolyl isomerase [Solirubrobacteraceae bacterium]